MINQNSSLLITYCNKCRFLNRSTWIAQEILTTFEEELLTVTLSPSQEAGVFTILINNEFVWDRTKDGHAINLKLIKQRIRDHIAPKKQLGHSDNKSELI